MLVTIVEVRGHAPRDAGTKMIVTPGQCYGTIGGGNLEHSALRRARELLGNTQDAMQNAESPMPILMTLSLTPRGGEHGVQCCGGEVTLLLEPCLSQRPHVAIFGAGHVGWALVRVLATLPIELRLIDSRADQLDETRLPSPRNAGITLEHAPVPETALETLPDGAHILILTHDHAEDLAILERALRRAFGYLGLIGSQVKWTRFREELRKQGIEERWLEQVRTPIGIAGISSKRPEVIAISAAAELLTQLDLADNL